MTLPTPAFLCSFKTYPWTADAADPAARLETVPSADPSEPPVVQRT